MRRLTVVVAATIAATGCAGVQTALEPKGPVSYVSSVLTDGSGLALDCPDRDLAAGACSLVFKRGSRGNETLVFTPTPPKEYLRRLVALSAADAVSNPSRKRDFPIRSDDLPFIDMIRQSTTSCFADKAMSDLIVACKAPQGRTDAVVVFLRGLCDRCDFEPVVVKEKR